MLAGVALDTYNPGEESAIHPNRESGAKFVVVPFVTSLLQVQHMDSRIIVYINT